MFTKQHSSIRIWIFRIVALLGVPALLLVALELGLRAVGYGRPSAFLVPDSQPGHYRSNQEFVSLFMPESFDLRPLNFRVAKEKPPGTLRVVVLGESAAQGIPAPAFGFVPQLRAQLRARYPGRDIEVVNTAIVAINSHVVYQIAHDLADFNPDLFVVYLGNNEVVGPYGPGCSYLSESPPLPVIRASVAVRATRTGQLLAATLARFSRRAQPAEWGGMSMFVEQAVPGDDPRLETVHRNFEANLRDIVRVAEDAGAKVLLSTVVANLKDCPPLLSRHRPGLAGDELARWQSAYDRGRIAWRLDDSATARTHLEEARRLDPQYADTLFMLGDLELRAGNNTAARKLFIEALRWDALRFRPDPRINDIIRRVAADHPAVQLVDTARLLGADPASEAPIAGRELLFEHVHFDWEGNHRVARTLAEGAETLLGPPPAGAPAWLDSAATAAAIGYTERERAGVLQKIGPLLQSPPFPNQLTYPEDMARFARESVQAQAAARDPAVQRRARETVATAVARDPDNPFLAKIEDEIADDLGDLPAALAAAERARRLQPENYAVAGNVAIKLARLGRLNKAETLLRETAARSPVSEQIALLPAFADLHTRMKAPEKHRSLLDQLHALRPGDTNVLLARARWAESQGDTAAAERDLRAILARDSGQQMALETLVGLLARANPAAAGQTTLDFADRQSRNHANNLRAALLAEQRNDTEAQLRFLLAAERSGPVPAGLQIRLARLLIERNQPVEALGHLAEARRIALAEGDDETRAAVEQYIRQMRGGGS